MTKMTLFSFRSTLCWLALTLALPVGAYAQGPPPQSHKPLRYILVLKAAASGKDEPDVAKAGGRVLGRSNSRQVIEIPLAALDGLSRHASVAYLALIDDGTPTDAPRYVLGPPAGTSSSARVATDATVVAPNWDSGPYAYDGSGNITAVGLDSYRYDEAQRLKTATVSGVPSEYTYDSFGNLVARKIDSVSVPASTSPSSNHLDYATYDRAGNQLSDPGAGDQEYEYDAANLMIQRAAPVPRRYVYTADDERIGTEMGSDEWEWTIRDFSGRVLSTYESFSTGELDFWIWQESHHYRGATLTSAVKLEERVTGATAGRYFHTDHLGTPRLITNQSRQKIALHDYHPFGRELTRHNQEIVDWMYDSVEPMQFTGHERDYLSSMDSNAHDYLDYMHARYYNPSMGRFLSVDPVVDFKLNFTHPQGWNRYAYVRNNPINAVDRDGRCEICLDNALERDQLAVVQGKMTFEQYQANNVARGAPAAFAVALLYGGEALGLANRLALNVMVRIAATWGGGAGATAEGLRRAAESGGSTERVVTNLTKAPQEGRALSAAAGEGAEALANAARSGNGVRTFAANIPKALISGLQQAGLLEIRRTRMNGVTATEYRFAAGASQYIAKFFKDVTGK